jgi:HD-GYP domain-containing protein (c-di-GMP phosphodiesterase class II)
VNNSGFWIRAFILGLGLAAFGLMAGHIFTTPVPAESGIALAILLSAFIATAYHFPIHFDVKSSIILDTSIVYAAVLLFEPGVAMLIILVGALIGHMSRRFDSEELVFNVSQATLQAGIAGSVLMLSGWNYAEPAFNNIAALVAIVVVPATIYLTNTLLVSVVIGFHTGMSPVQIWRQSTTRNDGIEQLGQYVVGLMATILAIAHPWALPLLAVPAYIIRVSLTRQYELRDRTILAVERLADLVDLRDPYTADHSRRVAGLAREIATSMGLDPETIQIIERTGRVHDLGKIVIDLGLLSKPGKLTDEEWRIFQQHPVTGVQMLELFPDFAAGIDLVRWHHERIDGRGYPDGLAGDEIPIGARILAVADGFDAMASPRPYRSALPSEVVLSELAKGRGTQWDAAAVDALLALIEAGRVIVGDANERPYIVDTIGYREPIESEAA